MPSKRRYPRQPWGKAIRDTAVLIFVGLGLFVIVTTGGYAISHADQKCVRYAHD